MARLCRDGASLRVRTMAPGMSGGKLILCGTPIGNLEDVTLRSLRVLGEADIVACEDSRRTRKLLSHHGVRVKQLVVHNDANERRSGRNLVDKMVKGAGVVLVSDAGMPGLSDPGYRLVTAAVEAGIPVEVVPGPSAAISAVAISGLPPARFVFEGFLPRKSGERRRRLEELRGEQRTMVFYESPHRAAGSIADMAEIFGPRPAAIARELTKMYEEVLRGSLTDLAARLADVPTRGELVVVVGGALRRDVDVDPQTLAESARRLMDGGMDRRAALQEVAKRSGVPKRVVFDALVDQRDETDQT